MIPAEALAPNGLDPHELALYAVLARTCAIRGSIPDREPVVPLEWMPPRYVKASWPAVRPLFRRGTDGMLRPWWMATMPEASAQSADETKKRRQAHPSRILLDDEEEEK